VAEADQQQRADEVPGLRLASGNTEDLDPALTSRSIAALVFAGATPR
jgi:hypothetical protein